jgi:nicotinate-nucleotide--dimethylbenzimidazole phosphoribosyltransferase
MSPVWHAAPCPEPSGAHAARARARQQVLTKPTGSLGRLEDLAAELAGLQASDSPTAQRAPILVFAADHGVTVRGVSAYPASVTVEMLRNFAHGGAAIAVLARELGSPLAVIDAGTFADTPVPGVVTDKPRRGTRDLSREAAMTGAELEHALACGRRAVLRATEDGADLLLLGEMGIGNTTSAAAIACALLGRRAQDLVGAGSGVDEAARARKVRVVDEALALHALARLEAGASGVLRCLAAVGGLEIAALAGAMIAAAQSRRPVLVDGFIASVAALAAVQLNRGVAPWLLYSHRSAELGHRAVLDALAARPLLDLSLRLGEASGAALALPLVRLACALHNGMATFAQAAVSGRCL